MSGWMLLLTVIVLMVVSAFFSASETALTAASRARIMALEKAGNSRAAIVHRLILARENLLGAVLLGNNLVNILASALTTGAFLAMFGDAGVAYATVLMTVIVLVFGEILPKTLAITNPDRVSLWIARPLAAIVAVLSPIVAAIQWLIRGVLRLAGRNIEGKAVLSASEEIRGQVELLHAEGSVVKANRDRLGGLLDLDELEVSDIMVHRTAMRTIDASQPAEKVIEEILSFPYTRVPLWEAEPENIIGVLHVKDLLRRLQAVHGDVKQVDVRAIASKPWFVPDSTSLTDQLNAFLKNKQHFALVVDEYGDTQGLVTLEDILEEIVGDISDEHDIVVQGVRPQSDGSVSVDGSVPIRDLNRVMDWQLPDEEATTIAGLVIHEARTIPEPGQAFTFYGFRFHVLRKSRNRLTALRVTPLNPQPRPAAAQPRKRVAGLNEEEESG